jgi:hypothetical protein
MVEVVIRLAVRALAANSQTRRTGARTALDMHYTAKLVSCNIIDPNLFIIFRYVW